MTNSEKDQILAIVNDTRKQVLDALELAFGASENFPFVRSRVLALFGRNGIEGKIKNILLSSSNLKRKEYD